jgi:hypothetical protein
LDTSEAAGIDTTNVYPPRGRQRTTRLEAALSRWMHVVSKGDATKMADHNRSYRRMILRGAARHKLEETTNKQTNKQTNAASLHKDKVQARFQNLRIETMMKL